MIRPIHRLSALLAMGAIAALAASCGDKQPATSPSPPVSSATLSLAGKALDCSKRQLILLQADGRFQIEGVVEMPGGDSFPTRTNGTYSVADGKLTLAAERQVITDATAAARYPEIADITTPATWVYRVSANGTNLSLQQIARTFGGAAKKPSEKIVTCAVALLSDAAPRPRVAQRTTPVAVPTSGDGRYNDLRPAELDRQSGLYVEAQKFGCAEPLEAAASAGFMRAPIGVKFNNPRAFGISNNDRDLYPTIFPRDAFTWFVNEPMQKVLGATNQGELNKLANLLSRDIAFHAAFESDDAGLAAQFREFLTLAKRLQQCVVEGRTSVVDRTGYVNEATVATEAPAARAVAAKAEPSEPKVIALSREATPSMQPVDQLATPGFDCTRARSLAENLVCTHADLASADV